MKKIKVRVFSVENLTLGGIVTGIVLGVFLPEGGSVAKILGDIFIRLLKMLIIPLVSVSIISAILTIEKKGILKQIGFYTIAYYLTTTALAVTTGLILVVVIHPSVPLRGVTHTLSGSATWKDLLLSFFPENIVKSFAEGKVLQVILFAILFSVAVNFLPAKQKGILKDLFQAFNEAFMVITRWIILLTPAGVFGLVYYITSRYGVKSFAELGWYIVTVVTGLLFHAFVTLPLLGYFLGRFNPYKYSSSVSEALLIALSTASSSATLPVSLKVAEEKGKVSPVVAALVLPLGATINMDGTALYEAVATVFIANSYGVSLTAAQLIVVFLTATLVSIGAAGIQGAGMVMMTIVLTSVGLPVEGIGLIVVVDRFLDMLRTSVNVWGDLTGAKIITRFYGGEDDMASGNVAGEGGG